MSERSTERLPVSDIIVVGAGLVGAPLAQVLAARGWRVVLLDAGDGRRGVRECHSASEHSGHGERAADGEHSTYEVDERLALQQRCTALSLGTQQWFSKHGLWPAIEADAAPIRHVFVSHKGYFGATRLHADELRVKALGYVVDNHHLTRSVLQQLNEAVLDYRREAKVVKVVHHDANVEVQLADGSRLQSHLLIAADGVTSLVRESVGIGTTQVDYDQAAALSTLRLTGSHHDVAYERFTASGPLALLPRTNNHMSVVDCMEPAEQASVARLDDAAYLARLQSRFGYRLGRFAAVGPRLLVPLVRIEATAQTAPRTVLLGNAMRLLHPVGGQGYNLAMRDVEALIRLLDDPTADPGQAALLERFVQSRRADQKQVVRFTDALARGFRGQASLPGHARSAALLGLDTLTPLRRRFARRTMGLAS